MKRDAKRALRRQRRVPLEPAGKAQLAVEDEQRFAGPAGHYLKFMIADLELHFFPTLVRHVSSIFRLDFACAGRASRLSPARGRSSPQVTSRAKYIPRKAKMETRRVDRID